MPLLRNGFRLYMGSDNKLHLDLIQDGMVTPLEPDAKDAKQPLGLYDLDFKYLGPEDKVA